MYRENLGSKLKAARNKTGFTQSEVAEMTDIKQSQISKIENGTQEPNIETLGILIDFYEVSADWILGTGIKKKRVKLIPTLFL